MIGALSISRPKTARTALVMAGLLLLAAAPRAQEFRETGIDLGKLTNTWGGPRGQVNFLDFDKDGDLDVLMAGAEATFGISVLKVYRNNGGTFSLFTDFKDGDSWQTRSADWADLDKDGYAEIVTYTPIHVQVPTGSQDSGEVRVLGYDPVSGSFRRKEFPIDVSGIITNPLIEFADYDKDGYPDLLFSGTRRPDRASADAPYTRVLRNNAGTGLAETAPFPTPTSSAVSAWGDLEGDGDLDLFLAGNMLNTSNALVRSARMFRYDAATSSFVLWGSISSTFDIKSAALGDMDRNGWADLVFCGGVSTTRATRFYINSGTSLLLANVSPFNGGAGTVPQANLGSAVMGDVDSDGDPDLMVNGEHTASLGGQFTMFYDNAAGWFDKHDPKLPPFWNSVSRFVDYDKDGHLDWFVAGTTTDNQGQTKVSATIYRNVRGDIDTGVAALDSISGMGPRWGDVDNDGDMDLIVCGGKDYVMSTGRECHLWRNDAGSFTRLSTPFDNLMGEPEWGDYDGDGRLDLLLGGSWGPDGRLRLFRNLGSGSFQETPIEAALPAATSHLNRTSARWGDFNRDGRPDLLAWGAYPASGQSFAACFSEILINKGGTRFEKLADDGIPGLCDGELDWGDIEGDGDLDVLLAGDTAGGSANVMTSVYRNDGGVLARMPDKFLGLSSARAEWGDFDADGDLDFAISGSDFRPGQPGGSENVPTTWIYRLVDGKYEEHFKGTGLIGDVAWIDFDQDGDLDLLNSGRMFSGGSVNQTYLIRNNGLSFAYFNPFTTLYPEDNWILGKMDVADYDKDGDPDFVVSGFYQEDAGEFPVVRIYRNTYITPNRPPSVPAGLSARLGLNAVSLSWGASSDPETRSEALRYNVRVGTGPGASDILAPVADPVSGTRLQPAQANAGAVTGTSLSALPQGTYYWSVQSVDQQTGSSSFAGERSFTLGLPAPELLAAQPGPGNGRVTIKWKKSSQDHFKRYIVRSGSSAGSADRVDTVSRVEDTVLVVDNLPNGTPWHLRVYAEDAGGNSSPASNELSAVPDGTAPAIPSGLSAAANDRSITLSWTPNTEGDFLAYLVYQRNASGPVVKVDSISSIASASKTITGLKNGTPYSFMVVAVDQALNYSAFSDEAVGIPAYLLTPSAPSVAFGKVPFDGRKELPLAIRNSSGLAVPVDSVRFVNSAFGMVGFPSSFPASAETTLTLIFDPDRPSGGDFIGVFKLYYGGSKAPLEIDLTGSATALPYCSIDQIVPADLGWDSTTSISFHARANDSDNAGEGDRIVTYLWSSSLAGPLTGNSASFTLRPDQLGLGTHAITLRVVDNEGDTSVAASGTVNIRSIKPLVRITSIEPGGLIIRGADRVRIRSEAHDRDEGASPARRDLASFALFSTLQGRLSGSLDTTLEPSTLNLGLHGFHAVAVDDEGDSSWSDTSWVPVQADVGLALVVAGTDFNDKSYYYENIAPNCNWVYGRLRQRGFTDSMITYFNPVGWQSIGADYHKDSKIVDETEVTVAKLRERILGFKSRVRNGVPLLISFIGHGGRAEKQNGRFYLSPEEYLDPDSLDAWLDTYNQDEEGKVIDSLATPIVLVFDFCFSGTFFPKLRSTTQNRMVITSSASDRQSYFQRGQSFSYALFRQVEKGGNLTAAFVAGKSWSDANATVGQLQAAPQANADNDNSANESEDFQKLATVYLGGSQQAQGPAATWKDVQLQYDAGGQNYRVQAYLEANAPVDTAWVTMVPPDFKPPQAGAEAPFITRPLERQGDGTYAGTVHIEAVTSGDYLFVVSGIKDGEDMMPAAKRSNPGPVGLARRGGIPDRFDLGLNYPNPAVIETFIPLAVTRISKVDIEIRGMDGRLVKRLLRATLAPGYYLMRWDGRDQAGRQMSPGVYSYTLKSTEGIRRRTLVWGR